MADNVDVSEGSGKTIAADDVGGVMFQRVKINYGTDGQATDVSDSNPLPIDDAGGSITIDGSVTVSGTVTANKVAPSNATASITSLASSATSAQFLAANSSRKGLTLVNTDANAVLVKFGTTASASSYTVRIVQNGYYEMPEPIYTGRIDAIWEADGSGVLLGTEL